MANETSRQEKQTSETARWCGSAWPGNCQCSRRPRVSRTWLYALWLLPVQPLSLSLSPSRGPPSAEDGDRDDDGWREGGWGWGGCSSSRGSCLFYLLDSVGERGEAFNQGRWFRQHFQRFTSPRLRLGFAESDLAAFGLVWRFHVQTNSHVTQFT